MRTHILIAALLATCALALTACGADPATAGKSGDTADDMQDAALKYARCMRDNGVDMPDPRAGQHGIRLSPPEGVSRSTLHKADQACRKYLEAVKPPEMSEEQQKKFRAAALANARCMREHGIDFPDPTFGPDGGAQIRIKRGSGIDPESAKFKAAEKACESTMPDAPGGEGGTHEESSP